MQIPHTSLSPEALQNLLEEFVTREGTEYGGRDWSLAEKTAQVKMQLDTGRAVILYDQASGTCHIETSEHAKQYQEPPQS